MNSDAPEEWAVLLHLWHPLSYSIYKHGDKSRMRIGPENVYDNWNISLTFSHTQPHNCYISINVTIYQFRHFFTSTKYKMYMINNDKRHTTVVPYLLSYHTRILQTGWWYISEHNICTWRSVLDDNNRHQQVYFESVK